MRVVIVEDERPAREKLIAALRVAAPDCEIAAELASVGDTCAWLAANAAPDLMFLDIQLSDGLSFDILQRGIVTCPVVFVTAFDEYLMKAFESTGIDYLLKPVRPERISAAVTKYRMLREHFKPEVMQRSRDRLLVRKGIDFVSVRVDDLAYAFTSDKLVFLVTRNGTRYLFDKALSDLEADLEAAKFFRVNRAFVVHIDSIARCRAYGKGKLILDLHPPASDEVIVSQERAAAFREWFGG